MSFFETALIEMDKIFSDKEAQVKTASKKEECPCNQDECKCKKEKKALDQDLIKELLETSEKLDKMGEGEAAAKVLKKAQEFLLKDLEEKDNYLDNENDDLDFYLVDEDQKRKALKQIFETSLTDKELPHWVMTFIPDLEKSNFVFFNDKNKKYQLSQVGKLILENLNEDYTEDEEIMYVDDDLDDEFEKDLISFIEEVSGKPIEKQKEKALDDDLDFPKKLKYLGDDQLWADRGLADDDLKDPSDWYENVDLEEDMDQYSDEDLAALKPSKTLELLGPLEFDEMPLSKMKMMEQATLKNIKNFLLENKDKPLPDYLSEELSDISKAIHLRKKEDEALGLAPKSWED